MITNLGKSILRTLLSIGVGAIAAHAAIKSELVAYKQDTTSLEGILFYDAAVKTKQPGIVLHPDWMGVSEVAKQYAEKTAKLGFVVLIADIYGKNVRPKDAKEAGAQAGIYKSNRPLMQARSKAALDQLLKSPRVDTTRIAAIGYCFGGGVALELGRSGANLDGIVSYHGNLDTPNPNQARMIKGKVLVHHGAVDPFVPAEQVKAFSNEMETAKVDYVLIAYGGAVHSFTNPTAGNDPTKGAAYNQKADERSFHVTKDFYREIFSQNKAK